MVVVALYAFHPFVEVLIHAFETVAIQSPTGIFVPHHVAHFIAVVKRERLENLLMQTGTVETHIHGNFDVLNKSVGVGRGVNSVLIEALIEHESAEHRLAVEQEFHSVEHYRAHTEIRFDFVGDFAVIDHLYSEVVKSAFAEFPQMQFVEFNGRDRAAVGHLKASFALLFAIIERFCNDFGAVAVLCFHFEHGFFGIDHGRYAEVFDITLADRFEPDALPDAGRAGIIAAVTFEAGALFAVTDVSRRVVLCANDDGEFVAEFGDFDAERNESAHVIGNLLAVNEHGRFVIDRTEVQKHTFTLHAFGKRYFLSVPNDEHEVGVADAAEFAFGSERNVDFAVERRAVLIALFFTDFGVVDFKFPFAVEAQPIFALELRIGEFSTINFHFFTPFDLIF